MAFDLSISAVTNNTTQQQTQNTPAVETTGSIASIFTVSGSSSNDSSSCGSTVAYA